MTAETADDRPLANINTSVPHSARVWNYWLGGKDNYAVDREAGDRYQDVFPGIVDVAREVRYFIARTVRYLAGEAGIRQFLDVGTGLPTVDNTHDVAQRTAPESRVVYVDNDPLVLTHARALLTSSPEGATGYIDADMRDPERILRGAAETLDLDRPIALMFMGVLGHVAEYDEARSIVGRLLDALPPGSYLALADSLSAGEGHAEAHERYKDSGAVPYHLRTAAEITGFFDGLDLVDPGAVLIADWRPDTTPFERHSNVATLGAVGRKG